MALLAFASLSFAENAQKELGYIVNARANPSYAGSVSGSGGGYTYGTFVFLQAKENMGWSFSNWVSKNGNCPLSVDSRGNAAVKMAPTSGYACSVEAVFKRDKVSDMVRKIGNSIAKKLPKVIGLPVKAPAKKVEKAKTSTRAPGGEGGGASSSTGGGSGVTGSGDGTGGEGRVIDTPCLSCGVADDSVAADDGGGDTGGGKEDSNAGGGGESGGKSDSAATDSVGPAAITDTSTPETASLVDEDGGISAFIMELFGVDSGRYKK